MIIAVQVSDLFFFLGKIMITLFLMIIYFVLIRKNRLYGQMLEMLGN